MRWRNLVLLFMSVLVLCNSCRKESEIEASMETGVVAGKSAFRILSLVHIIEQIALKRNDDFFTSQTIIAKTDSSYSDGDGIAYILNFGTGVLCTDGILRKGKCRLEITDTTLPVEGYCKFVAEPADSFAVFSKSGWEMVLGSIEWRKVSVDSATLLPGIIKFENTNNIFSVGADKPLTIKYLQPINYSKNGEIWNGSWNLTIGGVVHQVNAASLSNAGSCRSNWNSGKLEVVPTEPLVIDMDPFGTNACDQVFKVSRGKGFRTDEITFDAW